MNIIVKDIKQKIDKAGNIALFTHINCDCDGIASMCGLYELLSDIGKDVQMFCDSDIPNKYSFLNCFDKINKHEQLSNDDKIKNAELIIKKEVDFNEFDILIALDTSVSSRLGKYKETFEKHRNTISIDHHESNTGYAKINYVKYTYASCGEVLFEVLREAGYIITEGVATSLLAAISSDTNRFANSNISAKTHISAGELVALGANSDKVNLCLHKNKSKEQLALAGFMASNLKYYKEVAYLIVTLKDFKKLNVLSSDVGTFLDLICNVGNSKITVVAKERSKEEYRLNLRSVKDYDVNKVANVFDGGGHKNAAGCNIYGNFKKGFKEVLKTCQKEIDAHKRID